MESGGQLTISTEGIVERDMEGKERPYAIIRVRDNGPGISAKVLSTLFVPFVTTKDGGTGLGLSISHRIVTSAGGSIDVTSEEGAGAVFTVKFPSAGDASVHQSSPFGEPEVLAEGDGAIETASRTMAKR
ncbi:MAG: two-component system sensor protein, partial [Myxococcales bacterium]|nr:two-component system sensor protein [Myxococcales bacterium]